jgi:fatty-acyl-CoA synthase
MEDVIMGRPSSSSVLVYGEKFQKNIDQIHNNLNKIQHFICKGNSAYPGTPSYSSVFENKMLSEPTVSWDIGIDDLQMIMYTSGTTGLPKGVMFTHSQLLWSAATQVIEYSYKQEDVTLLTGPLYHVGALVDLSIGTANIGGTNVIMPSLEFDVEFLLDTIERERVTNLLLFPVMLIQIFKLPDLSKYDFGFLRFALVGGERIDPLILKKFQKRWPHTEAYQVYGLTEGSEFVSILDSEYMLSKAGSIGRPFFNVNIRLLSDDGKDVPVGEVAVYPVPDPVMTESVMASVVLQKGSSLTSEELIAYCKQYIASYKKPKYIEFVDSLPRTPSNKVMKYILQERNKNIAKK